MLAIHRTQSAGVPGEEGSRGVIEWGARVTDLDIKKAFKQVCFQDSLMTKSMNIWDGVISHSCC